MSPSFTSSARIRLLIAFAVITVGAYTAGAAGLPTGKTDAQLAKALIGTWQIDLRKDHLPEGKGYAVFNSDGTFRQIGVAKLGGSMSRFEVKGRWSIRNQTLMEKISSASVGKHAGEEHSTKIVSVDAARLTMQGDSGPETMERTELPNSLPPMMQPKAKLELTADEIRTFGIVTPQPEYPYEARRKQIEGSGLFALRLEKTGAVRDVQVLQSTGNEMLDNASVKTLRRWRFVAGTFEQLVVPIRFVMRH